jgi:hypothetical protein
MYISIFLHKLIYKEIGKLMTLYPEIPNRSELGLLDLDPTHGASLVRGAHHRLT